MCNLCVQEAEITFIEECEQEATEEVASQERAGACHCSSIPEIKFKTAFEMWQEENGERNS